MKSSGRRLPRCRPKRAHLPEMSRFENRRNTEIAAELNLSIKTVEFHIGKVLKVLRVRLKDYLLFFFVFILR